MGGRAVQVGTIDIDGLAKIMQANCTVKVADIKAGWRNSWRRWARSFKTRCAWNWTVRGLQNRTPHERCEYGGWLQREHEREGDCAWTSNRKRKSTQRKTVNSRFSMAQGWEAPKTTWWPRQQRRPRLLNRNDGSPWEEQNGLFG